METVRNLLVFPRKVSDSDPEIVEGVTDSNELVKIKLDTSQYSGGGMAPSLNRLLNERKEGSALLVENNGPELYTQTPQAASALLFNRVESAGGEAGIDYRAGWASVVLPGCKIGDDYHQYAPYQLGFGHLHYSIGQSLLTEGIGFVETPYLVGANRHLAVGERSPHSEELITAYEEYISRLQQAKQTFSSRDYLESVNVSMECAELWADFVVKCHDYQSVKPKLRLYHLENSTELDGHAIDARKTFCDAVSMYTQTGAFGGVYFRLKNKQTGVVLPSHSAVLMNSFNAKEGVPNDPELQFNAFSQFLGGSVLLQSVRSNDNLCLDAIPIQELGVVKSLEAKLLTPDMIRKNIVEGHGGIPVLGYNAKIEASLNIKTRVGNKENFVLKSYQPLSAALTCAVEVDPTQYLPPSDNSLKALAKASRDLLNTNQSPVHDDPVRNPKMTTMRPQ